MKKRLLALTICIAGTSTLFTGCSVGSNKYDSLKAATGARFAEHDSMFQIYKDKILELEAEINNLKIISGLKLEPEITSENLKFSSIKIEAENAGVSEDTAVINANSTFNVNISLINASSLELNQYVCQAFLSYYEGENYLNRYMSEERFNLAPKSTLVDVKFNNLESKGSNIKHVLTIVLKDLYGNEITRFEKELVIK